MNTILTSINENKDFCEDIKNGTLKLLENEKLKTVFSSPSREVKVIHSQDGKSFYVLDITEKNVSVRFQEVFDFEKDKKIEEILSYDLMRLRGKDSEKHSLYGFLKVNINKNKEKLSSITLLKNALLNEQDEKLKEAMSNALKYFEENEDLYIQEYIISNCENIGELKKYVDFLNSLVSTKMYDLNFYFNLLRSQLINEKEFIDNILINKEFLEKICLTNNFNINNKYIFNDLDNKVWVENGDLYLSDQSCTFHFANKKEGSFEILFYYTECNTAEEEKKKSQDDNNKLDHLIALFSEGKCEFLNDEYLIKSLSSIITYTLRSLKVEGFGEVEYTIDVSNYEYQKNYIFHQYHVDELTWLYKILFFEGTEFKLNEQKDRFENDSISYIEKMKVEKNSRENKKINYPVYYDDRKLVIESVNVNKLNEDWRDAFKFLIRSFRENKYYSEDMVDLPIEEQEKNYQQLMARLNKIEKKIDKVK